MKPRLSLSWKIALLAVINAMVVTAVPLVFAGLLFRVPPENFLVAPAVNRILNAAGQLGLDLAETPTNGRKDLLERFSKETGVDFLMVDSQGRNLVNPQLDLRPEVLREVTHPRPPGRGGPPRGFGGGGPRPPGPEGGPGGRGSGRPSLMFRAQIENPSEYWVGVRLPVVRSTDNPPMPNAFLLLRSDSFIGNGFFFDPKPWIALTLAVITVSMIVWLPLIRRLTHAISEMTRATGEIAEGQFDTRLAFKRTDEVGLLAASINSMSTQLAGFVKGQKRFLADIAHELCAPVARMQVALGILEQRAEEKSREYVADVKDEAQHMSQLINELMSFSKAGMQAGETEIVKVDVAETIRRVLEREGTSDTTIENSIPSGVFVSASPEPLFRAISNLVRNAIRYAGHAGPISISARNEGHDTIITVADSGAGLPEDELEQVFAPFYRLEQSRGRDKGGTGLGLAIVKSCVEACKGTVRAHNRQPSGLAVEIRLRTSRTD